MKTRNGDSAGITRTGNIGRRGDRINEDRGTEIMASRGQENVIRVDNQDTGAGSAKLNPDKGIGINSCHQTGKDQQRLLGERRDGRRTIDIRTP